MSESPQSAQAATERAAPPDRPGMTVRSGAVGAVL
ncbi:unnamed protein product, partial [marine sediment metagenome]